MKRAWILGLMAASLVGCCDDCADEGTCATPGRADSATPDSATPDSATPDSATPDSATPDSATPDSAASDPDSATPQPIEAWDQLVLGLGQQGESETIDAPWLEEQVNRVRLFLKADGRFVVARGSRDSEVLYFEGTLSPDALAAIDQAVRQTTWKDDVVEGDPIPLNRFRVSIWQGERASIFQESFFPYDSTLTNPELALLTELKALASNALADSLTPYTPEALWLTLWSTRTLTDVDWGMGIPQREIDAMTAVPWPFAELHLDTFNPSDDAAMILSGSRLAATLAFCEAGRAVGDDLGLFFVTEQNGMRYPIACQAVPPSVTPTLPVWVWW